MTSEIWSDALTTATGIGAEDRWYISNLDPIPKTNPSADCFQY